MILSDRERLLIVNALYILECQCYAEEIDHDLEKDFNGTPKPSEVRNLMNKINNQYNKD